MIEGDHPDLEPEIVFSLALQAISSTEQVRGYSPFQWAYGAGDPRRDVADELFKHRFGAEANEGSDFAQLKRGARAQRSASRKLEPSSD